MHRSRRSVVAALIVATLMSNVVWATEHKRAALPIGPGDRIRLKLKNQDVPPLVGDVVAVDELSITVQPNGREPRRRLSWTAVSNAQISLGKEHNPGGAAAVGGVLLGIPMSLAGGAVAQCLCFGDESCGARCHFSVSGAALGLVVGAGVGGLIGSAVGSVTKTERWEKARRPQPNLSLGLAPTRGGTCAVLTVRF
jgi:hypothetical protein